jgi:hypothetical protein
MKIGTLFRWGEAILRLCRVNTDQDPGMVSFGAKCEASGGAFSKGEEHTWWGPAENARAEIVWVPRGR